MHSSVNGTSQPCTEIVLVNLGSLYNTKTEERAHALSLSIALYMHIFVDLPFKKKPFTGS